MSAHNLPAGYVPLEDLWDKPYFNMKITLKEAGMYFFQKIQQLKQMLKIQQNIINKC